MRQVMGKSTVRRATATGAGLNYFGAILTDPELVAADIPLEFGQAHGVDINNGERFETYVMAGQPGGGEICLNGAAARLAQPGDRVIVISYAQYSETELAEHRPVFIFVDDQNRLHRDHIRAESR